MAKEKPQRYVELADGKILDADAGLAGPDLWIMFRDGTTMQQGLTACSKEDRTSRIVSRYPGGEDVYEGYTAVHTIRIDLNGRLNVRLRRPADMPR